MAVTELYLLQPRLVRKIHINRTNKHKRMICSLLHFISLFISLITVGNTTNCGWITSSRMAIASRLQTTTNDYKIVRTESKMLYALISLALSPPSKKV